MAVKTDWLGRPIKRATKAERRTNTPKKLPNKLRKSRKK